VQRCQCQKQRAKLNQITASLLAWARLHKTALLVKTTVYALKQALLDAYLCKQLRYLAFAILLRKSYTIKLLGDMYVSHLPENF
ncbi:MAG: hypothetical protein VX032_11970, partial [SAR324 cluster bacterium]|nr:hypothetical protein [SAR324 cluster bacterium]